MNDNTPSIQKEIGEIISLHEKGLFNEALKKTAHKLNNTATVCKKNYIDPYLIELYIDDNKQYEVSYDIYDYKDAKYIYNERDYQLKRALDLIKGLSIFEESLVE